ncbi:MAG: hypothetical protein DGJ47_000997 [Rickettsiaceae bacterium]
MKIFLDTTNLEEIKKYQSIGIIDGVTTNPSLMAKSEEGFYDTARQICELVKGDVSLEAVANEYDNMIVEGNKILEIAPNVVIKLPITFEGLKACKYFSSRGKKVNMTLCFSANQALLAAKNGATYISPFIGRLDDIGEDGMELIEDIRIIYDNYGFETQILAASIRSAEHVHEAALCGADVATMGSKTLSELVKHPLTDKGLQKFTEDWANSGMKI